MSQEYLGALDLALYIEGWSSFSYRCWSCAGHKALAVIPWFPSLGADGKSGAKCWLLWGGVIFASRFIEQCTGSSGKAALPSASSSKKLHSSTHFLDKFLKHSLILPSSSDKRGLCLPFLTDLFAFDTAVSQSSRSTVFVTLGSWFSSRSWGASSWLYWMLQNKSSISFLKRCLFP